MAAVNAPVTVKEAFTLPRVGINPQFINVTMERDKNIRVCDTLPQNSVMIIDMSMPNQPLRLPMAANSTIMNPISLILALKASLNNMIDFALPYLIQFICEYTRKVDELIKEKIEAINVNNSKENEEQDVVKQHVTSE